MSIVTTIDADSIVYRIAHVTEEETEAAAFRSLDTAMEKIFYVTEAQYYAGYLTSSSHNFRIDRAFTAPYKGNRENVEKPKHFAALRKRMIDHWKCVDCVGIEADDAVIIHKVHWEKQGYEVVLCSSDKDSLQEPGTQYNPNPIATNHGFIYVTEDAAQRNFYTQMIVGDSIDNIKGLSEYVNCDNVAINGTRLPSPLLYGPKAAQTILDNVEVSEYFPTVAGLYCDLYAYRDIIDGTPLGDAGMERFYENWDLLYMLRETPEDVDLDLSIYEVPETMYYINNVDAVFGAVEYDEDDKETEY